MASCIWGCSVAPTPLSFLYEDYQYTEKIMKKIPLRNKKKEIIDYALVDDEDYEWLNQWSWFFRNKKRRYVVRQNWYDKKSHTMSMHRQIMNPPDSKLVDHINRDPRDNRKCNLRMCTSSQNSFNQKKRKNVTSKYKGVSYSKERNKWVCMITCKYKDYPLGRFKTEQEAAKKYNEKAKELFGEFAYLNEV